MLDSGSSVSLIREDVLSQLSEVCSAPPRELRLVTAAGEAIPVAGYVSVPVQLGQVRVMHPFVVVKSLIAGVILGIDFLQQHGLVLDFAHSPIKVLPYCPESENCHENTICVPPDMQGIAKEATKARGELGAIMSIGESPEDVVNDCAIPRLDKTKVISFELPSCSSVDVTSLMNEFKELFRTTPGTTTVTQHFIPTSGPPVKIPPRRVPANYRKAVEEQLQSMLNAGIIEESSSPWMAPAVYVPKKSGEIRICIDYRELNKKTIKDAYPLPRPDEVQDKLQGSAVFSILDLQSGYWQLPVHPADRPKTAFSPGPGMGLFQFTRMPFGLSNAPGSFQRLMDKVCRGLPFVTTYLDDLLIHSATIEQHKAHLREIFERLQQAGLTLRGKKCRLGLSKVAYLGHIFSADGMSPDDQKSEAIRSWPTPTTLQELKSFLGLASYYRRYVKNFADIAAPLNLLTQKDSPFVWDSSCQNAFQLLKEKLTQAPILAYPCFGADAPIFHLLTDASASGLGAILEQGGQVIAYASRALSEAEKNYSVIQRECLAIMYGVKQFRHYLLGRSFNLITDHAPLQWLSGQKMEGLLARWALALQEFDFHIVYRKGAQHGNVDALSRRMPHAHVSAATSCVPYPKDELQHEQKQDPHIQIIWQALKSNQIRPQSAMWQQQPLRRYGQLWSQLTMVDGVVCRQYRPGPTEDIVTVPIIPITLRQSMLRQVHDAPGAGHLGIDKTLEKARQQGYWVSMYEDVVRHCQECSSCQQAKLPSPSKAPMTSIPIGRPWQMVAVDVLAVPPSYNRNRYLLVIQDYFTKWVEAVPLPDQTTDRITNALVQVFSTYGMPEVLHSDQGKNFESTLLQQTLATFGIHKSRTTAYHPEGDGMVERFNRSLLQMLRVYVTDQADWERFLPLMLFAYRTSAHSSTGISPFELMFGRSPHFSDLPPISAFDAGTYQCQLRTKLAQLQDLVDASLTQAGARQKHAFDQGCQPRSFELGEPVWLSIPTAGKLSPRWEGGWMIQTQKGPSTYGITDGSREKVVHINRLQRRVQPSKSPAKPTLTGPRAPPWQPPLVDHDEILLEDISQQRRYPQRTRRPPDRLQLGTS